jgi:penicillin-binding protein 1C
VGRPDGTPNPGHFGANVAAPLVSDIVAGLPSSAAPTPRVRPASVSQARICWPLGVRYSDETRHLCHEERIAWLLHDTAPPTFPDKLRSADPREIQLIKTSNGLRAYPECTSDPLERRETARWPTVLEAWVDPALRKRAIGPAWDPNCAPARDAARRMQIVGVTDGTTLSRAGARAPLLRLELRGHGGEAHWMVNGQWIARSAADRGFTHEFAAAGRYEITALDDHGRYDRISLSVR